MENIVRSYFKIYVGSIFLFVFVALMLRLIYIGPDILTGEEIPECIDNEVELTIEKSWTETTGVLSARTDHYVSVDGNPYQVSRDIFSKIKPGQVVSATETICNSVVWGETTFIDIQWESVRLTKPSLWPGR
jgi:hypothetical protein